MKSKSFQGWWNISQLEFFPFHFTSFFWYGINYMYNIKRKKTFMQGGFRTNECMFDCEFLSFAICNYGFSNFDFRSLCCRA